MKARLLLLAAFLFFPGTLFAQLGLLGEGYIVFKDGYTIHGKILQQKQLESDPASGVTFVIPSPTGFTFIDDEVRRIYFPPGQIGDIVKLKAGELDKDIIMLAKQGPIFPQKPLMLGAWRFDTLPQFDKSWERSVKVIDSTSSFPMKQRIVQLSPHRMRIQSISHNWEINYFTKELQFADVTKYVNNYLDVHADFKKMSKDDKNFILAKFYHQMGKFDEAENIVKELIIAAPEHKKKLEDFLEDMKISRAKTYAADFPPLAAGKQHRVLIDRLAKSDREPFIDKIPEKSKLLIQELRNKYDDETEKLKKTEALLAFMMAQKPESRGFWLQGTDTIRQELNFDTLPRLDTFVTFAEQYQRDVAQGKTPNIRCENVLALAITGWHLGTIAAEPDIELAQKLWKGRKLMPEYMKTDTAGQRNRMAETFVKETNLPIDVVARLLQHLPPPNAYEKPSKDAMQLDLDLPGNPAGTYLIQLPADYNHQRAHPVLFVLHDTREAPEITFKRWVPLANKHGFILVAPLWSKFSKGAYYFSAREHEYFKNCVKDVKRRFQVDTDRVFLFGWGQGGEIAWDVGLAHPDQFAGVLPMSGVPQIFAKKYWQNAQNLGFYIVDGDKSGSSPVETRRLFRDWIKCNYNAYYVEYKGRAIELYLNEFEPMMEWMSHKKRRYPTRTLGTFATSGVTAEEFRSLRTSDNRFYWLSSDQINDANTQEYTNWVNNRSPALFQGSITVVNSANSKGDARISTEIALRLQGMKQCTVWLAPNMLDFTKPVQIRLNGKTVGPLRNLTPSIPTMLEEYFSNVDRQRLFHAKIELKI